MPEPAPQLNPQFAELVFLALDHGIDSLRNGGSLIPLVFYDGPEGRQLHRFLTGDLEASVRPAREHIATRPADVTAYALAYDGHVTLDGQKQDAVLVEASERGRGAGVFMAQRYMPKRFLRRLRVVGNPVLIGECETLL